MMWHLQRAPRAALVVLTSLVLHGCGGGGGGGSGGGGDGGTLVPSGLLPAAPAVGAVLVDDASLLRPLRDGTVLTYRGVRTTAAPRTVYSNTVTQVRDGGSFREDGTDVYGDGPERGAAIFVEAGTVKQREVFQLVDGGASETVELVELRSPVRASDRYVALDKRVANVGVDLDGDRVNDAIDVAIWAQVAGEETVDLPNRLDVITVRVDTTVRLRARYSVDGTVSEVVELRITNWYAENLGIVKSRVDSPNENVPSFREVVEEILVSIDAGDSGIGSTQVSAQVAPSGSNIAGQPIPLAEDAVAFDTHAVVLTPSPGVPSSVGFGLSRLDMRGQVQATTTYRYDRYDNVVIGGGVPRLVRVADELKLFFRSDAGLHMADVDGTGVGLSDEAPILLGPDAYPLENSTSYHIAAAGAFIWVAWVDYPDSVGETFESTLRLQRFTASGAAAGAPIVVEAAVHPGTLSAMRVSGSADRVLLSWATTATSTTADPYAKDWHYLVADAASGDVVARHDLTPLPASGPCSAAGTSLWLNGGVAFVCDAQAQAGVMSTGTDLAPVRAGNGDVQVDALLPSSWVHGSNTFVGLLGGDRLTFADRDYAIFWPEDSLESVSWRFGEMPAAGAMPDASGLRLLARVPAEGFDVMHVLEMGNRLLVVGTDCRCSGGTLRTMVVWR